MIGRRLFIACFALAVPCGAAAACAGDLASLRVLWGDVAFPLHWVETGMSDGRPLAMAIEEREGALRLRFVKAEEGLWLEGPVSICAADRALRMRFTKERVTFGEAAPWLLRHAFGRNVELTIHRVHGAALKVSLPGWSGTFEALAGHE